MAGYGAVGTGLRIGTGGYHWKPPPKRKPTYASSAAYQRALFLSKIQLASRTNLGRLKIEAAKLPKIQKPGNLTAASTWNPRSQRLVAEQFGVATRRAPKKVEGDVSALQKWLQGPGGQQINPYAVAGGVYDRTTRRAYQTVLDRSRDISLNTAVRTAQDRYERQRQRQVTQAHKTVAGHITRITGTPLQVAIEKFGNLSEEDIRTVRREYQSGLTSGRFSHYVSEMQREASRQKEIYGNVVTEQNRNAIARSLYRVYQSGSDADIIKTAQKLEKKQEEAERGFLGDVFRVIEIITEPVQRAFYAAMYTELQGGDFGDAFEAFFGSLATQVGVPKDILDQEVRQWVEATDTWQERQQLHKKGQLASFGEFVSGKAARTLRGRARREYSETLTGTYHRLTGKTFPKPLGYLGFDDRTIEDITSASYDAFFQVAADPTTYVSAGLRVFGNLGFQATRKSAQTAAQLAIDAIPTAKQAELGASFLAGVSTQASRNYVLQNTRLGAFIQRRLDAGLALPLERLLDPEAVQRVFRGLPWGGRSDIGLVGAVDVANALRSKTGGIAAAKEILTSTIEKGHWIPEIAPIRGVMRSVVGLGKTQGLDFLGEGLVRTKKSLNWLQRAANEKVLPVASHYTRDPEKWTEPALSAAFAKAAPGRPRTWEEAARTLSRPKGTQYDRVVNHFAFVEEIRGIMPGLAYYVEARLKPLLVGGKKGVEPIDFKRFVSGTAPAYKRLGETLREVELVRAIVRVDRPFLGEAAARQLNAELNYGLLAKESPFATLLGVAAKNVGLRLPKYKGPSTFDGEILSAAFQKMPDEIQTRLYDDIAALLEQAKLKGKEGQKASAGLAKYTHKMQQLADHPSLQPELVRLLDLETTRIGLQGFGLGEQKIFKAMGLTDDLTDPTLAVLREGLRSRKGISGQNIKRGLAKTVLSFAEAAPPAHLILRHFKSIMLSEKERIMFVDRLVASLGFDNTTRAQMKNLAKNINVRSEKDLFHLAELAPRVWARQNHIPEEIVNELLTAKRGTLERSLGFLVGPDGKTLDKRVHTPAQNVEQAPLMQKSELKMALRTELAKMGDIPARMRLEIHDFGELKPLTIFGIGSERTIRGTLQGFHRLWKFMIVTNAYMPVVGFAAGMASGNLDYAIAGAALGGLGSVRYIGRVALIEENMRYALERGVNPEEFIPFYSNFAANRRALGGNFEDADAVRAGGFTGEAFENRMMVVQHPDWVVANSDRPREFLPAWERIINKQLQPAEYRVDFLVLARKAGVIDEGSYRAQLATLKASEAGQEWFFRFRGAHRGPKNWDEAVGRVEKLVDDYVPPNIARERLKGSVPSASFKDSLKIGLAPEVVHAQKSFHLLKDPAHFFRSYQEIVSRFTFEGPTNLNRQRMAKWIYADEYSSRLSLGVDPEVAHEIATEIAVEKTNRIMFRIDGESRFARRSDYIFPFQQPREEFLRVWIPLIAKHPGRAIRASHLAARAFNNGAEDGMFYQDGYGNWRTTIPGAAWLSDKLFGYHGGFDFNLKDLMIVSQGGAFGASFIPTLGGPYWTYAGRALVSTFPEFFEKDSVIKSWLFPFGPGRGLFRNETRFLWWAFTEGTPPWDIGFETEAENEHNNYVIEIARQMSADHIAKGGDANWTPPDDELKEMVRQFYAARAFLGSIFPAVPRPVLATKNKFEALKKLWTLNGTTRLDTQEFLRSFPEFSPYLVGKTKYVGPDDMKHWRTTGVDYLTEVSLRWRETIPYKEFKATFKQYAKDQEVYAERRKAFELPGPRHRERALLEWEKKHPEYVNRYRNDYYRDLDLAYILTTYPKHQREAAIEAWRHRYDVTHSQYLGLREKVKTTFRIDPWREARDTQTVFREVKNAVKRGSDEQNYVAGLQPAEQYKYWTHRVWNLNDAWTPGGDQQEMDRLYREYNKNRGTLFQQYPELTVYNDRRKSEYEKLVERVKDTNRADLGMIYDEIDRVKQALDVAYDNKDWSAYNALNDKRTRLYDLARATNDSFFHKWPDLEEASRDAMAMVDAKRDKNYAKLYALNEKLIKDYKKGAVEFISTDEEAAYLKRPPNLRQAYLESIIHNLGLPNLRGITKQYPGVLEELHDHGLYKIYWDWLTQFQKDLLERHIPAPYLNVWKQEKPNARGFGGRSTGDAGLDWAFSLLNKYNKRPKGAKAPAAYKEYLALPRNPAIRAEFLRNHPEVREWIAMGPMANMPPLYQLLVANIMIANGRWDGEELPIEEITDLAFARQQLEYWTQRPQGALRPANYDTWLAMPSGVAKAQYLNAHPEVQNWIRLGPMSNMPDEYREVIRDIMFRYGLWTQEVTDPLGATIQGYYRTPTYNRQQYLEQHPELLAYWSLTRSGPDNVMHDLANQYFAIYDVNAKRAFLQSHPELSQWFIDARTRRYERFLNQVARFMGSNPQLFEDYLNRQNEVLAELMRRFGEAPLLSERAYIRSSGEARTRDTA